VVVAFPVSLPTPRLDLWLAFDQPVAVYPVPSASAVNQAGTMASEKYDLTPLMTPFFDVHLVGPLLDHLSEVGFCTVLALKQLSLTCTPSSIHSPP
jgi:hypothetical protein